MKRISIAFPLLGRGGWTGGLVYLKNTLRVINSRLEDEIVPHVFLSPEERERFHADLEPLVPGRIIVDPHLAVSGRGRSLARALVTGQDRTLERILQRAGIDVVFENAGFYGARFAIPVVSWIPDLQHRHMPELFGRANWWRRDIGFRMQLAGGRTIMLSSETARADLERFYPQARGRAHVVRFAVDVDIARHLDRGDEMRATYALPDRFYFLPNQFWKHKNHAVVIDALAILKAQNALEGLPPVILSGQPKDPRSPEHFDQLMARASALGVESHFRYLGLIPYDHVLALNAACDAMINPSRFEGWSTPIEESKAFATPLILSDIPIHREQAPQAQFFDPASPAALAEALLPIAKFPVRTYYPESDLFAAQNARLFEHADALRTVVLHARKEVTSR